MKPNFFILFRTLVHLVPGLVVFAVWMNTPCAIAQTLHVVTNADDSGSGSLRQAIADAAEGDEIIFSTQLIGQAIILNNGQLTIDKDLAITGLGADSLTISGNNSSRIFDVQSDVAATIQQLTITGGLAELNGGGIWTDRGASLTVNHTVITGNLAMDNGGGIFNSGDASVNVINTVISDNEAQGVLSPNGGAIYNAGGIVKIENSTLTGNKSTRGGAIWNSGSGAMEINNTLISDNIAENEGGGIFNNNRLTITNSTISGNQADLGAGGIKTRGGDTLAVINSTISGNQSGQTGGVINEFFGTAIIQNATIYGNKSGLPGAGILNNQGAKILIYSTIVALNAEDNGAQSDILDLNGIGSGVISQGFNFIGNGDAKDAIVGSKRFERLPTDFVGFDVFPLDPMLGSLGSNGAVIKAHTPLAGSPVIDNGDCLMTGSDIDQLGAPRRVDIPGPTFSNAGDGCDIGAVEASLSVALPIELPTENVSQERVLEPAFPNPFLDQTTFNIRLTREQDVTITLHNMMGQLVRTIHAGTLLPNTIYTFSIDAGGLASGVYIYRVSSQVFIEDRLVLLQK